MLNLLRTGICVSLSFFMTNVVAVAQAVRQIRAQQNGTAIEITYELETDKKVCTRLSFSPDGGYQWMRIENGLSGDIGFDQSAGSKKVVWNVLQTFDEFDKPNVKFKVEIIDADISHWSYKYSGKMSRNLNSSFYGPIESHLKSLEYPIGRFDVRESRNDRMTRLTITDFHCTTGPGNAAYSLLLPGLGSLKVTGGRKGWSRLLGFAVCAGVGIYSYGNFRKQYDAYEIATTEPDATSTYQAATKFSRLAICSFGLSFGIGLYDGWLTFKKGIENKKLANRNKDLYEGNGKIIFEGKISAK